MLFATLATSATAHASTELVAEKTKQTAEQILTISNAVKDYKKKYNRLPGDKNQDGMIGTGEIAKQLNATQDLSTNNETVLFWQELSKEGYLKNFQFMKKHGAEYPKAAIQGAYFTAGFINGSQDTIRFTNRSLRGNALFVASDKGTSNDEMTFSMTTKEASDIDEDLDDGNPAYRLVRGYGECVEWTVKTEVRRLNGQRFKTPKFRYKGDDLKKNCGIVVVISEK